MNKEINSLLKLTNKRDSKLEQHCKGESWAELSNYPEERSWYINHISPIDRDIVITANDIIKKYQIPCQLAENVGDVYSNQHLIEMAKPKTENESIITK